MFYKRKKYIFPLKGNFNYNMNLKKFFKTLAKKQVFTSFKLSISKYWCIHCKTKRVVSGFKSEQTQGAFITRESI